MHPPVRGPHDRRDPDNGRHLSEELAGRRDAERRRHGAVERDRRVRLLADPMARPERRLRARARDDDDPVLFAAGGKDLRTPLREGASDEDLLQLIGGVWAKRADRYSEERAALTDEEGRTPERPRIEMYHVGG